MRRLLIVVLLLAAAGCGKGQRSKVHGRITFEQQALAGATVILMDSTDQPHRAVTKADGTYEIEGVLRGPIRVAVVPPEPRVPPAPDADLSKPDAPKQGKPSVAPPPLPVDPRVSDFAQSGLKFELTKSVQEFSTDLPRSP